MARSTPHLVLAVIVVSALALMLLTRCGTYGAPRQIDPPVGPTMPEPEGRFDETTAVEVRVL